MDFKILTSGAPCVKIYLEANESLLAEPNAVAGFTQGLSISPCLNTQKTKGLLSGFGAIVSPVLRKITGEPFLLLRFYNTTRNTATVILATPVVGSIFPVDLSEAGGVLYCQRSAFLATAGAVKIAPAVKSPVFAIFSKEGIILQQIEGEGVVFLSAWGAVTPVTIPPAFAVSPRHLVAYTARVSPTIAPVPLPAWVTKISLFVTECSGFGTVYVQGTPASELLLLTKEEPPSGE